MGVAVGGHNMFPDMSWSDGYQKPWRNVGAKVINSSTCYLFLDEKIASKKINAFNICQIRESAQMMS